jgi:hypothetical protein
MQMIRHLSLNQAAREFGPPFAQDTDDFTLGEFPQGHLHIAPSLGCCLDPNDVDPQSFQSRPMCWISLIGRQHAGGNILGGTDQPSVQWEPKLAVHHDANRIPTVGCSHRQAGIVTENRVDSDHDGIVSRA